jgi:hypothetical protein
VENEMSNSAASPRPLGARVSKISLTVYVVLLLSSAFLLSVVGDYWPWYTVMGFFAIVPICAGPRRFRIVGTVALAFAIFLIVSDVLAGRHFHERLQRIREHYMQSQTTN